MIRVTHGGELDCNTCDRAMNTKDSSEGGRPPAGRARVDTCDDDDDDDGDVDGDDGDADHDENDVKDEV